MMHPARGNGGVKLCGTDKPSVSLFGHANLEGRIPARCPLRKTPCEVAPVLADEHLSVVGTPEKARASVKRFQTKADATPPDDKGPDDSPAPRTYPSHDGNPT